MILTILISLLISTDLKANTERSIEKVLQRIDNVLLRYGEITTEKENTIDSLRRHYSNASDLREQYKAYDLLFDEYLKWDSDSAYTYAHLKKDIAYYTMDSMLINDALMDVARRYVISGMHHEALSVMEGINMLTAEKSGQSAEIYRIHLDLYHWLTINTDDILLNQKYKEKEMEYLKLWHSAASPGTVEYDISLASLLINNGESSKAFDILTKRLSQSKEDAKDVALINYYIAKYYEAQNDIDMAIYFYAESAINDLILSNREYSSFIKVAQYCYVNGDIERAYNYIMKCHKDAIQCKAEHRISQIAGILHEITNAYETHKDRLKRRLIWAVAGISLAFILLVLALFQLRKSYLQIRATNKLKNTYLTEFLTMFAEHINALEKYRSNIRNVAKHKDFDILQKELRSDNFIDEEWDYLMDRFDKTFLGIYPNFISELNDLLQPDKQIGQDLHKGKLTNELRVFALIRLGITEPPRIAKFLRLSASTVYNYRNKLRNSYIGRRGDFDSRLMRIGN